MRAHSTFVVGYNPVKVHPTTCIYAHTETHLGRLALRLEARLLRVPLLLQREQRLLQPVVVDLLPADDAARVGREEVEEARGEEVDGAVAHADV